MRRWLIGRFIAAFERRYDYDMTYAREILAASPRAFLRYARLTGMAGYREDVPLEAWYAAKLAATRAEDCGPCTQLVVRMARSEGVPSSTLRAILSGDEAAMGEAASLGHRFARAVLAHHPAADALRAEVVQRYGERGLISLGFAVAATRVFPTLKYALGHGRACTRVELDGQAVMLGAAKAA